LAGRAEGAPPGNVGRDVGVDAGAFGTEGRFGWNVMVS
jgi:hypothetical protein